MRVKDGFGHIEHDFILDQSWTCTVIDSDSWFGKSGFFNKNCGKLHREFFGWSLGKKTMGIYLQGAAELARPEMLRQWLQEGADVEDGMG